MNVWVIAVQRTDQPRVFFAPGRIEEKAVTRWLNEASGALDRVLQEHKGSGGKSPRGSAEPESIQKHARSTTSDGGDAAEWATARAWSLPGEHADVEVPRQLLVVEAGQSDTSAPSTSQPIAPLKT